MLENFAAAELVALDVARAEAIVDHALKAAAMAMAAKGNVGTQATEYAKQILQVASSAAKKVLQVRKKKLRLRSSWPAASPKNASHRKILRCAPSGATFGIGMRSPTRQALPRSGYSGCFLITPRA